MQPTLFRRNPARDPEEISQKAAAAVRAGLKSIPSLARLNALISDDMLLSLVRAAVTAAVAEEAEEETPSASNVVAFPAGRALASAPSPADTSMSSLERDIATMFPALNTDQASTLARAVRDVVSEAISAA